VRLAESGQAALGGFRGRIRAAFLFDQVILDAAGLFGNQYTEWSESLHSKIHLLPDANTVTGDFTQTVSMGASYGNAQVILRTDAGKYYAMVGAGGTEYEIAFTYGGGWKQRYLVKIEQSYYIIPIQWNSNKYLDNSTGAWVAYNPQNWFDAAGTPKPTNINTFRKKSWDKNCSGCHITGNDINLVVSGADSFYVSSWAGSSSAANIVVGCESCHGPGSLHPANAFNPDKKIINPAKLADHDRQLEVCGQCHFRGFSNKNTFEFPWDEDNDKGYLPGEVLAGFRVNKPGVWPDGVTARQHHQQYQEFLTSKHYTNPFVKITCFTCHDPHQPRGDHQIVDSLTVDSEKFKVENDDNTLCLACHATHEPFAGITKDMVKDPVANQTAIGAVVSQHTRHSYDPTNANSTNASSRCSRCHYAKTAITAKAYDIHTHTTEVIQPQKTLLYQSVTTPTLGMLNSCAASCHRNGSGNVPNFGITDATLSAWNEQTDIDLATELKFWDENMFYKQRGGTGAAVSALPATAAPTIDADTSDWDDIAWADVSLANAKSAAIKSKVSSGNLYMLFRWTDPTMSMVRGESWVWNGATWTKNPGQSEDRIALMWNIDIPADQWEQNGCMSKCHFDVNNPVAPDGDPEDDSYLTLGHGDLWHMKPARGLGAISAQQSGTVTIDPTTHQATSGAFQLVGYLDDQNMKEYVGKPDGGRVGDSGSGADTRNRNAAQTGPIYIEKNPTDYIDAMVLTQAEINAGETAKVDSITVAELDGYWAKYAALNAVVPERYVKPPTLSRGDVQAAGLWNNGVWYVEIQRALSTGNADDASLTLNSISTFGIALMDNDGGEEHWTQGSVLNQLGVGITVDVEATPERVPSQYALLQNYPNPFNPMTTIRYETKSIGWVSLKIYNMLGQEVATLVDRTLGAGTHAVAFNATNLPSGVYFYRLSVNGFNATKKLLLMK
jgi:hypothetical protein